MGMCQQKLVTYPARRLTALRPTSDRSSRDPGPWVLALRRLHTRGYSDAEIATTLSQLSTRAILALEAERAWSEDRLKPLLLVGSGEPWTRRQVEYQRRQLGLRGNTSRLLETREEARLLSWRMYQTAKRWGHLLPSYDRDGCQWGPGVVLRPREADILSLLRDRGPQTRPEIAKGLKLGKNRNALSTGRTYYLARLRQASLVVVAGLVVSGRSALRRYDLGDGVLDTRGPRLLTGPEKMMNQARGLLALGVELDEIEEDVRQ